MKYNTTFQTVGAAYDDSLTILEALNMEGSWEVVADATRRENLLKKKSNAWVSKLVEHFRRRFIEDHPPLPDGHLVSKLACKDISRQAKIQVLYQYICESDPLIDRLINGLLGTWFSKYEAFPLRTIIYEEFILQETEAHPELSSWSPTVFAVWRRKFYAFLRSTGLMDSSPSVEVRRLVLRPESFAFILFGLLDCGLPIVDVVNNRVWERFFMREQDWDEMLSICQVRGWLSYSRLGGIWELTRREKSLEVT